MSSKSDITKVVIKIVSEILGVDIHQINNLSTSNSLIMDSLDHVEIHMSIEEEFDIEIPDEHAERFTTINSVVEYIILYSISGKYNFIY